MLCLVKTVLLLVYYNAILNFAGIGIAVAAVVIYHIIIYTVGIILLLACSVN